MSVMLSFVWTITLNVFQALSSVLKDSVSPLPSVLTLENSWVHVSTMNSDNIATNIKVSINETLSLAPTLNILYIQPNNSHVQLRQHLDYSRFRSKHVVVENMVIF